MSEDTQVVNWEEELARQATAAAAMERPRVSNISLQSGIMSYQGNPIPGNRLNCIVIASVFERAVYEAFDPGNITPPLCFAHNLNGENMVPHEAVPNPINDTCLGCKYDQFGSDFKGRKGKACKEVRKLAVLAANKDHNYKEAEIAVIRIPVMSVPNWSTYVNKIAGLPRPPYAVVTEISVVPDLKTQFKALFQFIEKLPVESLATVRKHIELGQKILLTPYDMTRPEPQDADMVSRIKA